MFTKKYFIRYFALLSVFLLAILIYTAQLLNMQFANAEEYQRKIVTTYTKTFTVSAVRGEIFDRNGEPLVTNQNIYNLMINGSQFPKKNYAELLSELIRAIESSGCETQQDGLPIIFIDNGDGSFTYSYSMGLAISENERNKLYRFLAKNNLDKKISPTELVSFLLNKYSLLEYDGDNLRQILGIYYDFDRMDVAGGSYYTLSEDITPELIAVIKENSHNYPGAEITFDYKRVYNVPGAASHILGTVGPIFAEDYEVWDAKGYPMDAKVGKSGVELAFEEYLRGESGKLERTYDQNGNVVEERYIKEPIRGKNVYLTIDIKLQQIAEHSIKTTIDRIHQNSLRYGNPNMNGGDAEAGAAAVIKPDTGEILALATYPSYDLTMISQIEYYNELSNDPLRPFINRAVDGTYPPGSIFKIATSVALLEEEVITEEEEIQDLGKYMKYADSGYAPTCWYYPRNHGFINVTQAIEWSCNYFFFVASERLGIENLNKYSKKFGLGERTGIEIGETKGILASKEYAEATGKAWTQGQLLGAAIGQGWNLFSPLQTVTMLGTLLNQGVRYSSHLLLKVKEYGAEGNDNFYLREPEIVDVIEMSDVTFNAVKQGLKNVIESGTAVRLFRNFPVQVGGKTGTAQRHENESNLATFVAFAPYETPEIALSVIIENGAHGEWAGYAAEDILSYYYGIQTYNELMGIPDTPEEVDEVDEDDINETDEADETPVA